MIIQSLGALHGACGRFTQIWGRLPGARCWSWAWRQLLRSSMYPGWGSKGQKYHPNYCWHEKGFGSVELFRFLCPIYWNMMDLLRETVPMVTNQQSQIQRPCLSLHWKTRKTLTQIPSDSYWGQVWPFGFTLGISVLSSPFRKPGPQPLLSPAFSFSSLPQRLGESYCGHQTCGSHSVG